MPRSQVRKSRMFRDFSKMPSRFVKINFLKNIKSATEEFVEGSEITKSYLYFMLFVYDLEFFTISWVADEYGMNKNNLADRMIYPLVSMGYLYKHFDKLTPSQTLEDHLFRAETKFTYRVRYALSQKGRMAVQRFYNSLKGR